MGILKKVLWMKVTKDEYQLPMVVAPNIAELARKCGTTTNNIYSIISKSKARGKDCQYIRVEYEDDEEEVGEYDQGTAGTD